MTKAQVKFVKGYLYQQIANYYEITISEFDKLMKERFGFEHLSDQDEEMFYEICLYCFRIGDEVGLDLNFPNNEWIKIYDI
jgi:hypothetical protein